MENQRTDQGIVSGIKLDTLVESFGRGFGRVVETGVTTVVVNFGYKEVLYSGKDFEKYLKVYND